jgi:hypothetical protein
VAAITIAMFFILLPCRLEKRMNAHNFLSEVVARHFPAAILGAHGRYGFDGCGLPGELAGEHNHDIVARGRSSLPPSDIVRIASCRTWEMRGFSP